MHQVPKSKKSGTPKTFWQTYFQGGKHFTWLLALIPSTLLRPQVECTMARFTLGCATSMSGGSASHWPRRKASTTATSWAATAGWVGTKYLCPTRTKTMREEEAGGGGSREGSAESKHETAGVLLLLKSSRVLINIQRSLCVLRVTSIQAH